MNVQDKQNNIRDKNRFINTQGRTDQSHNANKIQKVTDDIRDDKIFRSVGIERIPIKGYV